MKYHHKVERFKNFLKLSVEGPSNIRQWVEKNLIKERVDTSTMQAFFEAEQKLIISYLQEKQELNLLRLIQEFTNLDNSEINRIQLGILRKVLREEEAIIEQDAPKKLVLTKAFSILKDFAKQDTNPKVRDLWQEAEKALSEKINDPYISEPKQIGAKTSFIDGLATLSPKNYLLRYKCIFDIWEEIINKSEDIELITEEHKTSLPKPEDLASVSISNALSSLQALRNKLGELKTILASEISNRGIKEKLNAEDFQMSILNYSVDGCLLSLEPFLNDIAALSKHLEEHNAPELPSTIITEPIEIDSIGEEGIT